MSGFDWFEPPRVYRRLVSLSLAGSVGAALRSELDTRQPPEGFSSGIVADRQYSSESRLTLIQASEVLTL